MASRRRKFVVLGLVTGVAGLVARLVRARRIEAQEAERWQASARGGPSAPESSGM